MEIWYRDGIKYTIEDLAQILQKYDKVIIGSDSKYYRKYVKYATVVCVHTIESGVTYWYSKSKRYNVKGDIQTRIWTEVNLSMDIALSLQEYMPLGSIEVHCDINSNPKYASNRFNVGASGYVIGCGFNYKCKPDAWAASDVADWYTK